MVNQLCFLEQIIPFLMFDFFFFKSNYVETKHVTYANNGCRRCRGKKIKPRRVREEENDLNIDDEYSHLNTSDDIMTEDDETLSNVTHVANSEIENYDEESGFQIV